MGSEEIEIIFDGEELGERWQHIEKNVWRMIREGAVAESRDVVELGLETLDDLREMAVSMKRFEKNEEGSENES